MYKGQEAGKGQSGGEAEAMGTSSEIDGREVGFVRGNGGRRPGEVTRVEGFGGRVGREGGEGGGDPGPGPNVPRDKWEAYELAADGR